MFAFKRASMHDELCRWISFPLSHHTNKNHEFDFYGIK